MLFSFVSLLILGVVWGASQFVLGRSLLARFHRSVFAASITITFGIAVYYSFLQYSVWSGSNFGQFFLPPYQGAGFFFFFILMRFFAPHLLSFLIAFIFLWVAMRYNKKYDEQFFEKEEVYVGALSVFLVSHPGWIIYFVTLAVLYMLIQLYDRFVRGRVGDRVPLYHLWVPAAIFVILISEYWLSDMGFWLLLKF